MAQMLTANRLIDGTVLYWRAGQWVESLAQGEIFASEAEAKAALAAAQHSVTENAVVNPYLLEMKGERPLKEREIIRALGPSVHENLGKQAEGLGFRVGHRPPPDGLRPRSYAGAISPPQGGGERDDDVSI